MSVNVLLDRRWTVAGREMGEDTHDQRLYWCNIYRCNSFARYRLRMGDARRPAGGSEGVQGRDAGVNRDSPGRCVSQENVITS